MITDSFFRRNLPHWQPIGATFFVTYRLAGTLPRNVINRLKEDRQRLQALPREPGYSETEWNTRIEKRMFALWDEFLDKDTNIKWLSEPRIAKIIQDALYYFAREKYYLWAYVIMPNHVHVIIQPTEFWIKRFEADDSRKAPYEKCILSAILHSLRSYTAKEANKILSRTGKFWQSEVYDHWVREDDELQRIIRYIETNPVNAGLVKNPEDWYFSSAHDRIQKGLGTFDKII